MKKFMSLLFAMFASFLSKNSYSQDFVSDIAGSWYPSQKKELQKEISKIFPSDEEINFNNLQAFKENIQALLLPHAGYVYSGKTAAKAIRQLTKTYQTVIIVGPSHRYPLTNTISLPVLKSYSTPLGKLDLDAEKAHTLLNSSEIFKNIPEALENEHSVQIIVPLLQFASENSKSEFLKNSKIIFLITGKLNIAKIKEAADAISKIWDDNTLLIASTDFTHYGPRFSYMPFGKNADEKIRELDLKAFSFVEKLDAEGFYKFVCDTDATICGMIPVAILTQLASSKNLYPALIEYTDSSKISGDKDNQVSYISAVFVDKQQNKNPEPQNSAIQVLTQKDKEILLQIARKTIQFYFENNKIPTIEDLKIELTDTIKEKRACFVTLKIKGELRGCIGDVFPRVPLYQSVINNSINSAFEDPRFPPLKKSEFNKIHIEISAMTIPKNVSSYKDIVIGRDGIILSKGLNRALFLPQVATEQGWTLEETLTRLALKAGLPPDGWKEGTSFQVFQAEVFGEE